MPANALRSAVTVVLLAACIVRAQEWNVIDQPDLARQLAAAPAAAVEPLGPAVRSVQPWSTHLVPNRDGKSWDVLQWYFKAYRQKTRVYITDLGTGETTLQGFPDEEGKIRPEESLSCLHWDGNMYGATPDWSTWTRGGRLLMYRYDPSKNRLDIATEIMGVGGERTPAILGPDGRIYGAGTYLGPEAGTQHKVSAYWYDPRTGESHNYGPLGPDRAATGYGYWMGVDDEFIYVASGKIPWYLVAVNIATGEQTILAEAPPGDYAQRMWVHEAYPGAWVCINRAEDMGAKGEEFWLWHGKLLPRTDRAKPPWEPKETPWSQAPPRPTLYTKQTDPDENGRATLWARLPTKETSPGRWEYGEWRTVHYENVETHPLQVHRLVPLPDGRIFGTAQAYKGRFIWDTARAESRLLGRGGRSPYAMLCHDGMIYWSGYASAPLYRLDPAKPWTLERGGPPDQPPPHETDAACNPRLVGDVFAHTRVKKMMSMAEGADGCLYIGGIGQRDYTGGGLGWYNPATGEVGGAWKPFSGSRIHWVTPALGGTRLIVGTRRASDELNGGQAPESAKVLLFDVATRQVVGECIPVEKCDKSGPILETADGRAIGITDDPADAKASVLYGMDVRTGAVLFRRTVPGRLNFPWSQGTGQWDFAKGPDGAIYTYLDGVLVRIHPLDGRIEPIGRVNPVGKMCFVGGDLYLAGAEDMRRIKGLAAPADR